MEAGRNKHAGLSGPPWLWRERQIRSAVYLMDPTFQRSSAPLGLLGECDSTAQAPALTRSGGAAGAFRREVSPAATPLGVDA